MKYRLLETTLQLCVLLSLAACASDGNLGRSANEPSASVRQSVPAGSLVILNGVLIDGTGAPPVQNGLVVIKGDRILAIGEASDFRVGPDSRTVDAHGGAVLPGIINSHVHQSSSPWVRQAFLMTGVTSVCDLGSALDTMAEFAQREVSGGFAARGFRAGPCLTAPGGYPGPDHGYDLSYEVASPPDGRLAVQDLLNRGADVIKIALEPGKEGRPYPMLDSPTAKAIVEEAHAHGLLVRAHVSNSIGLEAALQAGVDVVEHVPSPSISRTEALEAWASDDPVAWIFSHSKDLIGQLTRMARQGVVLVPTLDVSIGPLIRKGALTREAQASVDYALEIVKRFKELGGKVALGNDYGNPGVQIGMPLQEMKLLLRAGLTSMEVVQAATQNAAFVSGHAADLGTLHAGKLADIIIVDGNPLADIESMAKVALVIQGGLVVYPPEQ